MSRFRLFLAWLVMAALPLQGMAAASMLFCDGPGAQRLSHAMGPGPHPVIDHHAGAPGGAAEDVSAHGHAGHGHAHHGDAVPDEPLPTAGPAPGEAASAHAAGAPDHSCAVCASCCHVVAVGGFDALPQASPAPRVEPSHGPVRVTTRTFSVPDKPPRA